MMRLRALAAAAATALAAAVLTACAGLPTSGPVNAGVVISDDLGVAAAVTPWSYGYRAYYAVNAGVQMLLTVTPNAVPAMYQAVLEHARTDASFRNKVNVAALHIYRAKQAYGLLPPTC